MAAGTAARRRWWGLLGALVAAYAAALTAGVTFGTFSDAATSGSQVGVGTISIGLTRPGGPLTPLVASSFYPGNSVSQELTLTNEGTSSFGALRLTASATPASVLTTDPVNGLQLTVSLCSRRWTADETPPAPTYSCAGTSATLYSGPFVVDRALTGLDTLTTAGAKDQLLVTVALPASADDRFQGRSAAMNIAFRAQQPSGRPR